MTKRIQAIRGMNDWLPETAARLRAAEDVLRAVLEQYGYSEIRLPIVEQSELFARSIGEATDIVEKEMYTFEDRNGDRLTLRPEGTAGCVRAGIEHGLLHNQVQKWWYNGPMFRHERPQKGRYRQFHQVGVEAFGVSTPDLDAELILLAYRIFRALGIDDLVLELNTLGTPECRARYREALVQYLRRHEASLDEDSRRRLDRNPLRILDSKNPELAEILAGAPTLADWIDTESAAHFELLKSMLAAAGVPWKQNVRLVRGLDYYTRTVFEWTTTRLGAQSAVCAGGRYDGLVEQLGGSKVPAAGFAIGLERLVALLELLNPEATAPGPDLFIAVADDAAMGHAMALAESLRNHHIRVELGCGGGKVETQLKRAARQRARSAMVIGAREVASGRGELRDLATGSRSEATLAALHDLVRAGIGTGGTRAHGNSG